MINVERRSVSEHNALQTVASECAISAQWLRSILAVLGLTVEHNVGLRCTHTVLI